MYALKAVNALAKTHHKEFTENLVIVCCGMTTNYVFNLLKFTISKNV